MPRNIYDAPSSAIREITADEAEAISKRKHEARAAWRALPRALKGRSYYVKARHGVDGKAYIKRLETQAFCCLTCGTHEADLDHHLQAEFDPATLHIRALLCSPCKQTLEFASRRPIILQTIAAYIQFHGLEKIS